MAVVTALTSRDKAYVSARINGCVAFLFRGNCAQVRHIHNIAYYRRVLNEIFSDANICNEVENHK